jgi:hypothetical protein
VRENPPGNRGETGCCPSFLDVFHGFPAAETALALLALPESGCRRIVNRGPRPAEGGANNARALWRSVCARRRARRDAEGGIGGSGVVHDAVFVFESSIIMDDDVAHGLRHRAVLRHEAHRRRRHRRGDRPHRRQLHDGSRRRAAGGELHPAQARHPRPLQHLAADCAGRRCVGGASYRGDGCGTGGAEAGGVGNA